MNQESKLGEEEARQSLPKGFSELMRDRLYVSHVHWVWQASAEDLRLVPRTRPLISHVILCCVLLPGLCLVGYRSVQGRSWVGDGFLQVVFTGLPLFVAKAAQAVAARLREELGLEQHKAIDKGARSRKARRRS